MVKGNETSSYISATEIDSHTSKLSSTRRSILNHHHPRKKKLRAAVGTAQINTHTKHHGDCQVNIIRHRVLDACISCSASSDRGGKIWGTAINFLLCAASIEWSIVDDGRIGTRGSPISSRHSWRIYQNDERRRRCGCRG